MHLACKFHAMSLLVFRAVLSLIEIKCQSFYYLLKKILFTHIKDIITRIVFKQAHCSIELVARQSLKAVVFQ